MTAFVTPTIYDLANFLVTVILLFVCSGMHRRSIKDRKELKELREIATNSSTGEAL
jgi:hypothetical protein